MLDLPLPEHSLGGVLLFLATVCYIYELDKFDSDKLVFVLYQISARHIFLKLHPTRHERQIHFLRNLATPVMSSLLTKKAVVSCHTPGAKFSKTNKICIKLTKQAFYSLRNKM